MEKDVGCLDLSLTLLLAAAHSRKWHSHLTPFPADIVSTGDEHGDIIKLRKLARDVIHKWSRKPSLDALTTQETKLVNWLKAGRKFILREAPTDKQNVDAALAQILSKVSPSRTHHSTIDEDMLVYELVYHNDSEDLWTTRRDSRDVFYGFHGSGASNFHSILRHGLLNHMNARALYGEGIYLSKSFSTALTFTEASFTHAPTCRFGGSLRVVAVCQVIDDKSVYHRVKEDELDSPLRSRRRIQAPNSEGGQLPTDYIIVRNNEMQRIKYLLVFPETKTTSRSRSQRSPRLFRFFSDHRQYCWIIFYILCLIVAGIATNKTLRFKMLQVYDSAIDMLGCGDVSELEY